MATTYAKRRQALIEAAAPLGVDCILLNNPTNLYYFCGVMYTTYERFCGMSINTKTGEATLALPAMEQGRLSDPAIQELPYQDGEDAIAMLAATMKNARRVGLEKDYLRLERAEHLVDTLHVGYGDLTNISDLVIDMRIIKDAAEIEIFQEACRVTDGMLEAWRPDVRLGIEESALKLRIINLMVLAEDVDVDLEFLLCTGPNTAIAHGYNNPRALAAGDPIMVDFGAVYKHYYADITRTYFLGEPSAKMRELYEIVLEANLAGIAKVKPGNPLKEVDLAARKVIEAAGYGEYFTHRTGHGIGLDIHEDPSVSRDNEQIIQPGMVFTVEPGIYLPEIGGVRIEDDVAVTETGCRVLTASPKELHQVIL